MKKVDLHKLDIRSRGIKRNVMMRRLDIVASDIVAGDQRLCSYVLRKDDLDISKIRLYTFLESMKTKNMHSLVESIIYYIQPSDLHMIQYQNRIIDSIIAFVNEVYDNIEDTDFLEKIVQNTILLNYKMINALSGFARLQVLEQLAGDIVNRLYLSQNPRVLHWVNQICSYTNVKANYNKFLYNENIRSVMVNNIIKREFRDTQNLDGVIEPLYDDLIPDIHKGYITMAISDIVLTMSNRISSDVLQPHRKILMRVADWLIRNNRNPFILALLVPNEKPAIHEYADKLLEYFQERDNKYCELWEFFEGIMSALVIADLLVSPGRFQFPYLKYILKTISIDPSDEYHLFIDISRAMKVAYKAIMISNRGKKPLENMIDMIKYIINLCKDPFPILEFESLFARVYRKCNKKK